VLFAGITANAQFEKGRVLLGLSFGLARSEGEANNGQRIESITNRTLSIAPAVGLFVRNNLAVGLHGTYTGLKTGYLNGSTRLRNYEAGFFVRRYVPVSSSFFLFAEGALDYIASRNESVSVSPLGTFRSAIDDQGARLALYPGVAYVHRRIVLEASLRNIVNMQYTSRSQKDASTDRRRSIGNEFRLNLGNSAPLTLGIQVRIGR